MLDMAKVLASDRCMRCWLIKIRDLVEGSGSNSDGSAHTNVGINYHFK